MDILYEHFRTQKMLKQLEAPLDSLPLSVFPARRHAMLSSQP